MSKLRILSCSLMLSVCVPALAQTSVINVRTGLWEVTSERTSQGMPQMPKSMPQLPPEVLAAMPPAQRKQIENAMKSARANTGGSSVKKSCVTRETLARGLTLGGKDDPSCKRTVHTQSATKWEMQEICTDARGQHVFHVRYEAPTPTTINGTVNITMNNGGRTMSMKNVMRGRWLGPDCGDVKPK
jgi:hypothetical protein